MHPLQSFCDTNDVMDGGHIDDDEFERVFAGTGRYQTLYVDARHDTTSDDPAAMADRIRMQAVGGERVAQLAWGHLLLAGAGIAQDRAAALRWFLIASRDGDTDAMNMAGRCYELGWGTPVMLGEAARWYEIAADGGHAWAQFNLASLLGQGRGVALDVSRALTLLVRSARQGNAKAMNMLGRYRESNGDVPARPQRAATWYRRAAERGCFRGQFHHGRFLTAAGRTGEAREWFARSLKQAPDDFRRDAIALLSQHADPAVRDLSTSVGDRR